MVRDTLILYRKIAHLERELENARIAEDSAKYKLDQEIKAHEATRGVLQDLVLDRGGSLSDWLPTTRTIAGVPGNPAADGPQTETEPEGE